MKQFLFDCGTRDTTASLGIFALRVMTAGMMLIGHGMMKLQNFEAMKTKFYVPDFFPLKLMSPQFSLIAAIGAEVGASALLILGLATRPAAFVLGFTMVVAAFATHQADPWFMSGTGGAKEPALLYLIPMIAILLSGGGAYSLDAVVHKEGKRRRW